MKKICFILLAICFFASTKAQQQLTPLDGGSKIGFTIKNFGFNNSGTLSGLKGYINYNANDVTATIFSVSVDANTINTDNKKRDDHLRKEEYFGVAMHPLLSFTSSKVTKGQEGGLAVEGMLMIKGVSKRINFPFTVSKLSVGYLFQGSFEINRRDFGVGGSSAVLSDNLKVTLSIFAK